MCIHRAQNNWQVIFRDMQSVVKIKKGKELVHYGM